MENFLRHFFDSLKIDSDEQERISNIVKRHGAVNWKDALGSSQIKSKISLIEELRLRLKREDKILLLGGWIGLIPYLMNLYDIPCERIINVELDQAALIAADAFNENVHFHYDRIYADATEIIYEDYSPSVVINTSAEHFKDYSSWLTRVPKGSLCFFQSNNMFGQEGHVNCHVDLKDFISALNLSRIEKSDQIDIGNGWKRFMVIGHK